MTDEPTISNSGNTPRQPGERRAGEPVPDTQPPAEGSTESDNEE